MQSTENVFIIGGGIGGLNCARLLQKDYHVELIEAVSRLGGRVKTRVIDGIGCDCGAQFFSAEDSSVIRLVSELGLSDEKRPFDLSRFSVRKDAKSIPTKLNEIEGLVKFAGFIETNEEMLATPTEKLLTTDFRTWYTSNIGKDSLWAITAMTRGISFAAPEELAAAYGVVVIAAFGAECFSFKEGLEQIIARLKARLGNTAVSLNEKVTSLAINDGKVTGIKTTKREIRLEENDTVISTLPLPLLSQILPSGGNLANLARSFRYRACANITCRCSGKPFRGGLGELPSDTHQPIVGMFDSAAKFGENEGAESFITILRLYNGKLPSLGSIMNEAALIRAIPYKSDSAWLDAWDYGLPLVSPGFFALQKEMLSNLPRNLMLVGDFAGLPSLDAAVESSNVYSQAILER